MGQADLYRAPAGTAVLQAGHGTPSPTSLTLSAPPGTAINVESGLGYVTNTGNRPESWSLSVDRGAGLSVSGGLLQPGQAAPYTVTPIVTGAHSITLTSVGGGLVFGSPASMVASSTAPGEGSITDKYQFQQPLLFQRAHEKRTIASYVNSLGQTVYPAPVNGVYQDIEWGGYANDSTNLVAGGFGSDIEVICRRSRRMWKVNGGDWRGLGGVQQSATPWISSNTLPMGTGPGQIVLNVLGAVQHADEQRRHYALFLIVTGSGSIDMKGVLNATGPKSSLVVTRGGVQEDNPLWYSQSMAKYNFGTETEGYCNTHDNWHNVSSARKGILEFERVGDQSVPATAATLTIQHNGVISGSVTIGVMLVYPIFPDISTVVPGLAANYTLDAGIFDHADCAGAIMVHDGDTVATHANEQYLGNFNKPWIPGSTLYTQHTEGRMDPTLWGVPGVDAHLATIPMPTPQEMAALLPHRAITATGCKLEGDVQRSATYGDNFRVLSGADIEARGFQRLANGLGALEFAAAETGIMNGQSRDKGVTDGGQQRYPLGNISPRAYLKREHMGRAVDVRIRAYIMLAEGWDAKDDDLRWTWDYSSVTGKFPEELGLTPTGWLGTNFTGKFPIGVQQTGSDGAIAVQWYQPPTSRATPLIINRLGSGYSTSSDGYAHQGRTTFCQGHHKENFKGPTRNGASIGMQEFYDYYNQTPDWMPIPNVEPGQPSLKTWGNGWRESANQNGMAFLYQGRWYCYELHWHMNTLVHPYVLPPEGTDFRAYGHLLDGYCEAEIDGHPCAKTPVFATRSSAFVMDWAKQLAAGMPFDTVVGTPARMRPITNVPPELYMGASEMIFQHYTGGQCANPRRRSILMNGVVVTVNNHRIGPMAGVSRANGGLGV